MINCLIYYYPDETGRKKGYSKIKSIKKKKEQDGIKMVRAKQTAATAIWEFEDGEVWVTIPATPNATRGYRWHKAYIDRKIPAAFLHNWIVPEGIAKIEDFRMF